MNNDEIIAQTRKWIVDVVIGCNFCPFANRVIIKKAIEYSILQEGNTEKVLTAITNMVEQLESDHSIETSLLILPDNFEDFDDYLDLVEEIEEKIIEPKYEGVFQIASFHPDYLFAESDENDPANYTNRSPYPMIHILREAGLEAAIASYPGTEKIPDHNIAYTRQKGMEEMKRLRELCFLITAE